MPRRKSQRPKQSTNAGAAAPPPFALETLGLSAVLIATFIAYVPALNGKQLWDDNAHITAPELQSLHGLHRIWFELGATQQYYPLLHSAFWAEHKLWGDSVLGYHLVNVVLHMTAAGLVYVILNQLRIPGSLLATAIFALHPVMVESVAWISEQKNTLSAVFYLAAMLLYLRFDQSRSRYFYFGALSFFLFGLLTKTVTATLPAALLVIFWWQRGRIDWKRDVLPLVPFFLLGAVGGLMTAWVERRLVGAEGPEYEITLIERCLLAGRVLWFYAAKLLWPGNLIFIYPRWQLDSAIWWQWLYPIAVLIALAVLWHYRRNSRGPLAATLFFCGTLFPALGFLNVYPFIYSYVADHFQYLASLGLIVAVAAGFSVLQKRLAPGVRSYATAFLIVVVTTLALLTFRQSRMYADAATLYRTTIERNPECWMAHNNLASELGARGDLAGAVEHCRAALRINPNSTTAYNNLGNFYKETHRLSEAMDAYRSALALKPNDAVVHNNLGTALIHSDKYTEAIEHLDRALASRPNYAEAHMNKGLALALLGKPDEGFEEFRIAATINPKDVLVQNNWGIFLVRNDRFDEAAMHFEYALRLAPGRADIRANWENARRLSTQPR